MIPFPKLSGFKSDSITFINNSKIVNEIKKYEVKDLKLMMNLLEYYPQRDVDANLEKIFIINGFSNKTNVKKITDYQALKLLSNYLFITSETKLGHLKELIKSSKVFTLYLGPPQETVELIKGTVMCEHAKKIFML